MSRSHKKNPSAAFDALKEQVAKGKPAPDAGPVFLTLRSIKMRPEVFQHRTVREHESAAYVRRMADALEAGRSLPPLKVWWDGKGWTCVDGHHRCKAYSMAGQQDTSVPVEVFKGTPEDALAVAADANTKDKLQMSPTEKLNAGWRLVVMAEDMSKTKQATASDVSDRQIAYMRKAKGQLMKEHGLDRDALAELSWDEARTKAAGQQRPEWDEGEEERRAEAMAAKLRKALGNTAERQPRLFMMAVERYSGMLAKGLEQEYVEAYLQAREETE